MMSNSRQNEALSSPLWTASISLVEHLQKRGIQLYLVKGGRESYSLTFPPGVFPNQNQVSKDVLFCYPPPPPEPDF